MNTLNSHRWNQHIHLRSRFKEHRIHKQCLPAFSQIKESQELSKEKLIVHILIDNNKRSLDQYINNGSLQSTLSSYTNWQGMR